MKYPVGPCIDQAVVSLRAAKTARGTQTPPRSSAKNTRKRAKNRELAARWAVFQQPAKLACTEDQVITKLRSQRSQKCVVGPLENLP